MFECKVLAHTTDLLTAMMRDLQVVRNTKGYKQQHSKLGIMSRTKYLKTKNYKIYITHTIYFIKLN